MGLLSRLKGGKSSGENDESSMAKLEAQMNVEGLKLGAVKVPEFRCPNPKCKMHSIYTEPVMQMIGRNAAWGFIGIARQQRYICLNPKCPSYYKTTGTRFKQSSVGGLVMTHPFSQVCDENPFRIHL